MGMFNMIGNSVRFLKLHPLIQVELQKLERQSIMMVIFRLSGQERFMPIQQTFLLQKMD